MCFCFIWNEQDVKGDFALSKVPSKGIRNWGRGGNYKIKYKSRFLRVQVKPWSNSGHLQWRQMISIKLETTQ